VSEKTLRSIVAALQKPDYAVAQTGIEFPLLRSVQRQLLLGQLLAVLPHVKTLYSESWLLRCAVNQQNRSHVYFL
jgi:hypothetical protein